MNKKKLVQRTLSILLSATLICGSFSAFPLNAQAAEDQAAEDKAAEDQTAEDQASEDQSTETESTEPEATEATEETAAAAEATTSEVAAAAEATTSEVAAEEEPEELDLTGDGISEILEQAEYQSDSFAAEEGQETTTSDSKPSYFDLRNVDGKNYITPVRQQNPYGACWGFGAIAAAESSILSQNLAAERGYDADTLDLSEKQIAWFITQSITDESNPQYGEGLQFKNSISDKAKYNLGGFTVYATNLFASGAGPVEEQTTTDDGEVFAYKGKEGTVLSRRVTWLDADGNEQSGVKKVFYSDDDDWSIPDKYRLTQNYRLKESYLLPTPSTVEDGGTTKVYHPEATEAIKEQLLANRAVCISFRADHSKPGDTSSSGGFMSDNWSQCILADDTKPNHVVTIIGYDDDYPKEMFRADSQPPENGAWLVKNSWGSDLNAFPNNGYAHWGLLEGQDAVGQAGQSAAVSGQHTGYFWLSYYDKSMENPEAYSFETAPADFTIQQHDYMPVDKYRNYSTETTSRMANIFVPSENGRVDDVSFLTTTPGTTAAYKIYLLTVDAEGPEDGECVYESAPKTYEWGGYHKESLPDDANVIVARDQKYSVVVEETTPSGKYSVSFGRSPDENYGNCSFHAVVNEGESFLYIDDAWKDLSGSEIQNVLNGGVEGAEMDNFPIKTYLSPVDNGGAYLTVNGLDPYGEMTEIVKIDQQISYELFFNGGTDDLPTEPVITWTASNPDIISIDIQDSDNCKAVITGKQDGIANLIVDAGVYGKKIIKVKSNKYSVIGAELAPDSEQLVYTGEAKEPQVATVWVETAGTEGTTDVEKDVDYTVSYANNTLCGKADVNIVGINNYKGSYDLHFMIVPAKAKITKVTPGNKIFTAAFASQKDSGVDGYILSYTDTATGAVKTVEVGNDKTSTQVSGLTAGKAYSVTMKAFVNNPDTDPVWDVDKQEWVDPPKRYFGADSDAVTVKLASVTAKAAKASIAVNATTTVTPTVKNGAGTTAFKSSDTSIATVTAKGVVKGIKPGTVKITVTNNSASAVVSIKVVKAANPLAIKAKTATVKYANVKKKAQTLAVTKVINFTKKGQGTMTYTKASGNKKITINKKTGKVTVKKGLAKGTYKIKVKVKAAGNAKYKASAVKTVTFKVVVK